MISLELNEKVRDYLDEEISIQELEEWLVPREPIFLSQPDSEDEDIISAIELGLAEIDTEIRTEEEFRNFLSDVLRKYLVIWIAYPASTSKQTKSGSANTITENLVSAHPDSAYIRTLYPQ